MPRKDPEAKRAYQREWYARPGNRERTIAKTTARKHNEYAGVCEICGGPTVGVKGPGSAAKYCGSPACRSVWYRTRPEEWKEYRQRNLKDPPRKERVTLRKFIEKEASK